MYKINPNMTDEEFKSFCENFTKSYSRSFTTEIHFTFDGFFNKIYSNYSTKGKYSFYSGIPKIFNGLGDQIPEKENSFLAFSCLRNSLHNYSIYENPTKNKDKTRNTNNNLKFFSIDNHILEFKHGQYIEYGPFFVENFLVDKMLDKMKIFL